MRAISCVVLLGGQGLLVALLTGCPKSDTTTTVDAATTPATSASQVVLAPIDTTTASATATTTTTATMAPLGTAAHSGLAIKLGDSGLPLPTATTTSTATATPALQAQFKQCCAALHKQSQQQSPQAAQLAQAAGVCDGLVAAMGTTPAGGAMGMAPQLDQVKMLLAGAQLPPVCNGL